MIRTKPLKWKISVHPDLEDLVKSWELREDQDGTIGVVHVGFDRIATRTLEEVCEGHFDVVFLTAAAKYALPKTYQTSENPIAKVEHLPIYLATTGWGYDLNLTSASDASLEANVSFSGWVAEYTAIDPDEAALLAEYGIGSEEDYLRFEAGLLPGVRKALGEFRLRTMIGADWTDPTAFAKASPPWLAERPVSSLNISKKTKNAMLNARIVDVRDLQQYELARLLQARNFGPRSSEELIVALGDAMEEGPVAFPDFSISGQRSEFKTASDKVLQANHEPADSSLHRARAFEEITKSTLLESIRDSLRSFGPRDEDIMARRMGLSGPSETLQQISSVHGITRERVRQIEAKVAKKLRELASWVELLETKLTHLLAARQFPLPLSGIEAVDSWFTGIGQHSEALDYVLNNLCQGGVKVFTLDEMEYVGLLSEMAWVEALSSARRFLSSDTAVERTEVWCRDMVTALLPSSAQEYRELLWEKASLHCQFGHNQLGDQVLRGYGRGAEPVIEAVLLEAERPLHYTEIASRASARAGRTIDERRAHNVAAEVGLLLARGTYGSARHLELNDQGLQMLVDAAEEVVASHGSDRQWHADEILAILTERDCEPATLSTKYVLEIALQRSTNLRGLGRFVWMGKSGEVTQAARIDLHQAVVAMLKQARGPLTTSEIRQRLASVRGLNQFFQIQPIDPLIRIGMGTWGLNDRDIPLKRQDQEGLMDQLALVLDRRSIGIHSSEISSLIDLPPGMPIEALFCLAIANKKLRVSTADYLYLAAWEGSRRKSVDEAVGLVLADAQKPLAFGMVVAEVESVLGRVCDRSSISAALQGANAERLASGEWQRQEQVWSSEE